MSVLWHLTWLQLASHLPKRIARSKAVGLESSRGTLQTDATLDPHPTETLLVDRAKRVEGIRLDRHPRLQPDASLLLLLLLKLLRLRLLRLRLLTLHLALALLLLDRVLLLLLLAIDLNGSDEHALLAIGELVDLLDLCAHLGRKVEALASHVRGHATGRLNGKISRQLLGGRDNTSDGNASDRNTRRAELVLSKRDRDRTNPNPGPDSDSNSNPNTCSRNRTRTSVLDDAALGGT